MPAAGHAHLAPTAGLTPRRAVLAWPAEAPLAVLTAGPRARWTILARPAEARPILTTADLCYTSPDAAAGGGPSPDPDPDPASPPSPARLLILSYHLGAALEPASLAPPPPGPLGWTLDLPAALAFDRDTGRWHALGDADLLPTLASDSGPAASADPFDIGPTSSDLGPNGYTAIVRRALDAIAAGDVYQVNLAHRLTAPFAGSPRVFFAALLESTSPAHGAYVELPTPDRTAVCSASPELFLRYDAATRRVTTSPMKGTRPLSADPAELRDAAKDRAELDMITDLMRNDLGRVCAFGSMRVDAPRTIEPHAGSVWQATSTVSGTLRDGLTHADLIAATFPPGSVTGAPKIRAMQLIDELEPSPRGPYCGSIGWTDRAGNMELNVAIRTAVIAAGTLTYHAGAGIVADSDPDAEWAETLQKAEILGRLTPRGHA